MAKVEYERWNPRGESYSLVQTANQIVADYARQGFSLTLRQLYYQFVARGRIVNSDRSYKNLGTVINRGRMAGLIDWNAIEDRTRNLSTHPHWDSAGDIVSSAARGFMQDLWADQPIRIEVWVEKEALAGVIERPASIWNLDHFPCRGYVSQSEQWRAGRRIGRYITNGQRVIILHLGDHDPSGIDMTRDIHDRIKHFIAVDHFGYAPDAEDIGTWGIESWRDEQMSAIADKHDWYDENDGAMLEPFEVRRIALNMDQIRQYNPPPNPAKLTDSRSTDYISKYGNQSWELDALDPATIAALIETEVVAEIDMATFEQARDRVDAIKVGLQRLADRPWGDIEQWLDS